MGKALTVATEAEGVTALPGGTSRTTVSLAEAMTLSKTTALLTS